MAGWIYIATNEYMPGLVKIGESTRDPNSYPVPELGQPAGVPVQFVCKYQVLAENYDGLEARVHHALKSYRVNAKREHFKCSLIQAISAVRSRAKIIYEQDFRPGEELAEEIALNEQRASQEKEALEREAIIEELVAGHDEILKKRHSFVIGNTPYSYWSWQLTDWASGLEAFLLFLMGAYAYFAMPLFLLGFLSDMYQGAEIKNSDLKLVLMICLPCALILRFRSWLPSAIRRLEKWENRLQALRNESMSKFPSFDNIHTLNSSLNGSLKKYGKLRDIQTEARGRYSLIEVSETVRSRSAKPSDKPVVRVGSGREKSTLRDLLDEARELFVFFVLVAAALVAFLLFLWLLGLFAGSASPPRYTDL